MDKQNNKSKFDSLFNKELNYTLGFNKKEFINYCEEWEKITNEIKKKAKRKI